MDDSDAVGLSYEVERILAERSVDGQTFYLVKWLGYSDGACTWEPPENFDSDETLQDWRKAKLAGDFLDSDMVAVVEKRMADFLAQQNEEIGESESDEDVAGEEAAIRSSRKRSLTLSEKESNTKRPNLVIRQAGNLVDAAAGDTQVRLLNETQTIASPDCDDMAKPKNTDLHRSGQRFKSLSHQNNSLRKRRNEPIPDPASLNLFTPAQLAESASFDTAHCLPAVAPVKLQNESWLFIPEDGSQTPEPIVVSSKDVDASTTADGENNSSQPNTRISLRPSLVYQNKTQKPKEVPRDTQNTASAIHKQVVSSSKTTSDGSISRFDYDRQQHVKHLTPLGPRLENHKNSRSWGPKDIFCRLSFGKSVGDCKLVGLPWLGPHPLARTLSELTNGSKAPLLLQIPESNVIDRQSYQKLSERRIEYLAKGFIEPFQDTVQAFREFTLWLEQRDVAAIWQHPHDQFINMFLYSSNSRSWRDLARGETEISRSVLHLAFPHDCLVLSQSKERLNCSSEIKDSVYLQPQSDPARPLLLSTGGDTNVENGSTTSRPPALPRGNTNNDVDTGYFLSGESPISGVVSGDHESHSEHTSQEISPVPNEVEIMPTIDDQIYQRDLKSLQKSNSKPDLTIDFDHLLSILPPIRNFDRRRTRFFISFATIRPLEALLIQKWLTKYVSSGDIFTDRDPQGWKSFCEKSSRNFAIVLFLQDVVRYHKLENLGSMMVSQDQVRCWRLQFGRYAHDSLTAVRSIPILQHGSAFLITETNLLEQTRQTLEVIQYFSKNRKAGWKILFRPSIRSWLKRKATESQDLPYRRKMYIDILLAIIDILPQIFSLNAIDAGESLAGLDDLANSDDGGQQQQQKQQRLDVISFASLQGYSDDNADESPRGVAARDRVLLEYFISFAAANIHRHRRFFAFYSKQRHVTTVADSPHIFFQDMDDFINVICRE